MKATLEKFNKPKNIRILLPFTLPYLTLHVETLGSTLNTIFVVFSVARIAGTFNEGDSSRNYIHCREDEFFGNYE